MSYLSVFIACLVLAFFLLPDYHHIQEREESLLPAVAARSSSATKVLLGRLYYTIESIERLGIKLSYPMLTLLLHLGRILDIVDWLGKL